LHSNLAGMYLGRGEFDKALAEANAGIHHGPKIVRGYAIGANASIELNRPDEAKALINKALDQGLDSPLLHALRLYLALADADQTTQEKEMAWFSGKAEEPLALRHQANHAAALGRYKKAVEFYKRGEELARERTSDIDPRALLLQRLRTDALFGYCPTSSKRQPPVPPDVVALCGDVTAARKFSELSAIPSRVTSGPLAYVRGQVLLAEGRAKEASAIFADILSRKAANWGPEYPAAQVGLARAATRDGDADKARKAYESFFALWKNADSDIPLLAAARKEYAHLAKTSDL
jgi:tetratricopeptide (TPR) repeat protein